MDEPILVVISLTMFVGSYLAGCIPLFFSLNERRIRIASIFGAGLLVGTAFCVIIPEGISSLAESSFAYRNHNIIDANLPKLENGKTSEEKLQRRAIRDWLDEEGRHQNAIGNGKKGMNQRRRRGANTLSGSLEKGPPMEGPKKKGNDQPQHHNERMNNFERLNGVIGLSLLVGFLFMHVIDQLSKLSHSRHKGVPTLGLVIHAFADGIAMGSASSAGSQMELQILVFVAIMLHKAPTAFALISILLASGMDKVRVRRHLLIFSLAAPIGTVLTYAFLHMIQSSNPSDAILTDTHKETSSHFTGMVLLFSAGTFLYIATVHVLPELVEAKCSGTFAGGGMSGSREMLLGGGEKVVTSASASSRFSLIELCLFCTSAIIPSFISSATHGEYGH
uniref:Zinc transporter ZIP9 n=1 Tax=Globodera rostochiensis TaxID=31243 RepID=A0A914HEX6_GLORO